MPPNRFLRQKFTSLLFGSESTFILTRYSSAVLVAIEALFFARILGPDNYGHYALLGQMVVLLLIMVAGGGSGYYYAYYKNHEASLDRYYIIGALGHYLLAAFITAIILYFFRPYLMISVILFLIQAPYFITEPMLRVQNHFTVAAVGKGFGSLMTVAIAGGWLIWDGLLASARLELPEAIWILVLGNLIGYSIYYLVIGWKKYLMIKPLSVLRSFGYVQYWTSYWHNVLRIGLPLAVPGVIWLGFTYVDRLFIEYYRPSAALSTYALAWQLSQGALLMLTSLTAISRVAIGEALSDNPTRLLRELRRQFLRTALAGALTFAVLIAGTLTLSMTIYQDYQNLVVITFLLSVGYIAYNIAGSTGHFLFYERQNLQLNLSHGAVLLASLVGNILIIRYNLWHGVPVAVSSLALIAFSFWSTIYTRNLARRLLRHRQLTRMP